MTPPQADKVSRRKGFICAKSPSIQVNRKKLLKENESNLVRFTQVIGKGISHLF
jgi:hypothetical protein